MCKTDDTERLETTAQAEETVEEAPETTSADQPEDEAPTEAPARPRLIQGGTSDQEPAAPSQPEMSYEELEANLERWYEHRPYPARQWRMPPLSTIYLCDDGCKRTLGEMIEGKDEEWIPRDDLDLCLLLGMYGADWTKPIVYNPSERDKALAELEERGDDGRYKQGLKRVK